MKPSKPSRSKKAPSGKTSRAPARKKAGAPRRKPPKKPVAKTLALAAPPENPRAKALAQQMATFALDKKAADVVILDVRGKSSYADYMVIASGDSERQVSAMAEHIETKLREAGTRPVGTEGHETGNWVLLDYGEVVAHLFFTETRAFYDLEGLWADAPKEKVA